MADSVERNGERPTVLVVEDNLADARLIERRLRHDFATRLSGSVQEAVDSVSSAPVDIVLMDLGLPDAAGVSGVERLRAMVGDAPILVVTGSDRDALSAEAVQAGAQDVLVKDDITTGSLRRAIEASLARSSVDRMRRRLERTDRLAAVGQLAAGVAHEVNNPAAFLLVNTEMCLESVGSLRGSNPDVGADAELADVERMLRENLEGVRRIQEVVRGLGAFAHLNEQVVEWVDVNDAVQAAVALARNEARHRATLRWDLGQLPLIVGHRGQICQVVLNLVINATHAIDEGDPGGNEIVVETRLDDDAGEIVVQVTDTGRGIAEDTMRRMFEPFFTTKTAGQGTGLGLSLSLETARRHGGELSASSRVGEGSVFTLRLPTETPFEPPMPRPDPPPARRAVARHRVMLIDDEPTVRRSITRLLLRHYDVEAFGRADEALASLRSGERFDVILCDLMMPGMDGAAFHANLERDDPDALARLVFVSGGAVTETVRALVRDGKTTLLSKPVASEVLIAAIDEAATRARGAG